MSIAVSIILIAVGAVLTWGVTAEAEGLDVNAIGVVLMLVGLLGLLVSLILWSSWGDRYIRRRTVVDGGYAPRRRTVVEEEDVGGPPGPPGPPA